MTDERQPLPPYLPYKTFVTFLDHLRAIGVPSHIDKSVMTQMSGAVQSWLKSALRYMKLVNHGKEDVPDARLKKLATAQGAARKQPLAELFKPSYAVPRRQGGPRLNTTPAEVADRHLRTLGADRGDEESEEYESPAFMVADGEGRRRVHGLLCRPERALVADRAGHGTKIHTAKPTRVGLAGPGSTSLNERTTPPLLIRTRSRCRPRSGGSITLTGDINLFELDGDERTLVFELIRQDEGVRGGGQQSVATLQSDRP